MLLNNRYLVLQELGSGAFGHTFLVEDSYLPSRRRCVLKQLKTIANPDQYQLVVERFQREAATLERLGDESGGQIPKLYAYFAEGDLFYLVQEWIEGETLKHRLEVETRLPEARVVEIVRGMLVVLDFIQQRNIIHRDIKPENIMLRRQGGRPVLIDFGMVKEGVRTENGTNDSSSMMAGTPAYMPVEQIFGKPVFASDLYSLGMTAIHLLTGKNPRDLTRAPGDVRWRPHAPEVSDAFAEFLDKATKLYAEERFQTARDMIEALEPASPATTGPAGTSGTTQAVAPQPPPPQSLVLDPADVAFWEAIKATTNPRNFMAYLGKFPTGNFRPLAEIRLRELTQAAFQTPPTTTPKGIPKLADSPFRPTVPMSTLSPTPSLTDLPPTRKNSLGIEFVLIPAGSFTMGSNDFDTERPAHRVVFARPFYLSRFLVTQEQWEVVMRTSPSEFVGDDRPVETVSWEDAQKFLRKLNALNDGSVYRLPSEAEWEYACRAGSEGAYCFGEDETVLGEYAWYDENSDDGTGPVGAKKPNAWGLYDMHGNVWEWCQDWHHESYLGAPTDGSAWETNPDGKLRVLRGGSWLDTARYCRTTRRHKLDPEIGLSGTGFRLAMSV